MDSDKNSENLIRSDYADIMVKVDTDVYHLDRLQLALKSDYFEKLFIEDFYEKKCDLVELPLMDSDTFSAVVDVIYGEDLESVITIENCISLLMAMDYLQMGIDLKAYASFINDKSENDLLSDANILILFNFIRENQNFKNLLTPVTNYLSSHLRNIRGYQEFLSLPFEHFIEIILPGHLSEDMKVISDFNKICVEWICHDWENRHPHIVELVNAVKRKLKSPDYIKDEKLDINLYNMSEEMRREKISKYFKRLLHYKGQINIVPKPVKIRRKKNSRHNFQVAEGRNKLAKFLENGTFYDITVRVEEKTYRLHRFKWKSMSGYFAQLFSAVQSVGETFETPNQWNKDKEYPLAEIDRTTFEKIINYVYLKDEVEFTSHNILEILKADNILQIKGLQRKCELWMRHNIKKINTELAVEILNLTRGNVEFEEFHKLYFRKVVPVTWPLMADNVALFSSISFDMLEEILLSETLPSFGNRQSMSEFSFDDQHKLLDICSKWVLHDVKNRYHLIPQIALDINCNYMVDYDDYKVETLADRNGCSQQDIRDELWKILCSTSLVPSNASLRNTKRKFKKEPAFISWSECIDKKIRILNADCDEIAVLSYSDDYVDCASFSATSTVINDNVFIISRFDSRVFCQVYNLSLKKCISLCDIPLCKPPTICSRYFLCDYTLLNCCNEVYCCYEFGSVLKYSIQLNRWTRLSTSYTSRHLARFASEGKKLYKMYKECTSEYAVEIYDFNHNVWISSPNLSLRPTRDYDSLLDLTFVNGNKLIAFFKWELCLFDKSSQMWHHFALPNVNYIDDKPVVSQSLNGIVCFCSDQLYNFSRYGPHWTLKKKISSEDDLKIFAIHRSDILCY